MSATNSKDGYKPKNLWTAMAAVLAAVVLIVTRFEKLSKIKDFANNWEEWAGLALFFVVLTLGVLYWDARKHVQYLQKQVETSAPIKAAIKEMAGFLSACQLVRDKELSELDRKEKPKPAQLTEHELGLMENGGEEVRRLIVEHFGEAHAVDLDKKMQEPYPKYFTVRDVAQEMVNRWMIVISDKIKLLEEKLERQD